jgi:hypothetical protein
MLLQGDFPQSRGLVAGAVEDDLVGVVPYIHRIGGEGDNVTGISQHAYQKESAPSETWHDPGYACLGGYISREV